LNILDGVCYNVHWESNVLKSFQDCFDLSPNHKWFVGPEEYVQHFPLDLQNERKMVPFLPGDMLQVSFIIIFFSLEMTAIVAFLQSAKNCFEMRAYFAFFTSNKKLTSIPTKTKIPVLSSLVLSLVQKTLTAFQTN
jgi:hypothetical protein